MKRFNYRALTVATMLALVVTAALIAFPQVSNAAPRNDSAPQLTTAGQGFCTYTVRRGDALYMIAARYGTTTAYLAQINNLVNPNYIYAGMVLRVPCGYPPPQPQPQPYPPQPKPYPPQPGGGICTYYIVQRGDWLKTIAYRFGISWQALAQANGLSNANYIYAGQRLAIPCGGPPQPPVCPGCYPCQGCPPPVYPPQPPVCPGCYPCQGCPPPVYPTQQPPVCPGCYPCQGCPPVGPTIYPPPYTPIPPTRVPPPPLMNVVELKDNYFSPAVITVHQGQWVQWINRGNAPHTVTQGLCPGGICTPTPNGFNSGIIYPGQVYAFQFNYQNTFAYFSQIDGPQMVGSVAVIP